jgi:hypothetical protein
MTLVTTQLPVYAQTADGTTASTASAKRAKHVKAKEHKETAEEMQLRELKESLKVQQEQIDALRAQVAAKSSDVTTAQQTAADAQTQAAAAAASAAQAQAAAAATSTQVDAVSSSVTDLKTTTAGLADTVVTSQKKIEDEINSPSTLHYKGVTIQPGGFAAAESVFRTRAVNSDIATPFSAIPYMNSGYAHITEFNGSARQSRLSVNVVAPMSWGKAGGYFEMDFLGAGTTSNNNQTNSYLLRVRSAFGQVTTNSGFSFQAGQMFTLATEDKKGVLAGPGAETLPPTIDPNYLVGFNFGRQYSLRVAQSFADNKVNVALAAEGSQIILASTSNAPGNFVLGGAGSTSGLFNSTGNGVAAQNYTDNLAPDVLAKVSFDPGYGHYEIGGILRFFRDRVYPQSSFSTTNATDSTVGSNYMTPGGGFFVSARVPATKYVDLALKVAAGDGTGRYGASNLGDVTVRPSGLLEPLRDAQGLFELDLHPAKKLDIFALGGIEYLQRTTYLSSTGVQVGYGGITTQNDTGCSLQAAPGTGGYSATTAGTCSGATRAVEEGNLGLTYRFFSSPTKGRFQVQLIYEYLTREGWQGYTNGTSFATATTFGAPKATENMVHTSFRYYIP